MMDNKIDDLKTHINELIEEYIEDLESDFFDQKVKLAEIKDELMDLIAEQIREEK